MPPALIEVRPGLFDQAVVGTLGMPVATAEHAVVYRAADDSPKYAHHAQIAWFNDHLYAMWSAEPRDEDAAGQHVVYSRSADGLHWSPPAVLAEDPDGPDGPLRRTAGGWWVQGETLTGFFSTFAGYGATKWSARMSLEARRSRDGSTWGPVEPLVDGFLINEPPRALASGRLLMTGEDSNGKSRLLSTDDPSALAGWSDGDVPSLRAPKQPNEPTWIPRPDGSVLMLFRDDNRSRHLFAARSTDGGATWSSPERTVVPDATAKARGGSLPDGSVFLISNPSQRFGRIPLAISLSADGVTFARAFAVRWEATARRYEGLHKQPGYQYPGAAVWHEHLYVIYSINKEDVAVTRIPLAALQE
ncbi:MAG: exo-alpha-sialidase [Actinobacteria bacterium]|nr:exo-alpha-sialidase [Actinomycetota bacterium]